MREITSHRADASVGHLYLDVTDEPGLGGANHEYRISWDGGMAGLRQTFISFQHGPIAEVGVNGIDNESLLAIVADRLEAFQRGPFACTENHAALGYVAAALGALKARTHNRQKRGVEGTLNV